MTRMIYHMCPADTWQEAARTGAYRGTADDLRDGFIHFSTAEQIAESARRHRAAQDRLVLIAVESTRLSERLKWETSRGGALFPEAPGSFRQLAIHVIGKAFVIGADRIIPQRD